MNNKIDALPEQVKDLGRKARARLEEERSKRPEIVRIETPVQNICKPVSVSPPKPTRTKKRRRPSIQPVVDNNNVDRYMPDTSHLTAPTTKEPRSNVVQLHGVPKSATASQIRRFFSGLDPQRVLLLLPFPVSVPELDAKEKPRKTGLHVERHDATLRILVKFESAPAAALAAQRSGEVLQVAESHQGAALSVTHMTKRYASCLVKTVAVDAVSGETLDTVLHRVESKLVASVSEILWASVIQNLKLKVKQGGTNDCVWFQGQSDLPKREALLRNEKKRLLNSPPFPSAEALDPTLVYDDPIMQMNYSCVDVLTNEVKRIKLEVSAPSRRKFLNKSQKLPTSDSEEGKEIVAL